MSASENEATETENTVEHFGRAWRLPSRIGVLEERTLNRLIASQAIRNDTMAMAEVFLSEADFGALLELNPTREEAGAFGDKLAVALGFKDAGNS